MIDLAAQLQLSLRRDGADLVAEVNTRNVGPGHAIPTVEEPWQAPEPQVMAVIDEDSGEASRVFSYRGLAQKFELSTAAGTRLSREQRDLLEYLYLNETLEPNLPLTRGLRSIDGYENLMPRQTAEYLAYLGSERATVSGFASDPQFDEAARQEILARRVPALAAAGVRYVTSGVPLDVPGLRERLNAEIPLPAWAGVSQPIYLYEVQGWRPRAYVARSWRVADPDLPVASQLDGLSALSGGVIVDREPGIAASASPVSGDALGKLELGPERLSLDVDLAAPGLLVVNEASYPGWSASVDGQPHELLTVNFMLRGLALGAGRHLIEMRYRPPGYTQGIAISLAALAATVGLFGAGLWAERRGKSRARNAATAAGIPARRARKARSRAAPAVALPPSEQA